MKLNLGIFSIEFRINRSLPEASSELTGSIFTKALLDPVEMARTKNIGNKNYHLITIDLDDPSLGTSERRKLIRRYLGLEQKQIAKRLGFSEAFYREWENGKKKSERLEYLLIMLLADSAEVKS